jgi:hypothetical protein
VTDTPTHPAGLLTDAEAKLLTDPDTDLSDHPDVQDRIRTRLTKTLHDCTVLYPTLPTADIDAVFNPDDDAEQSAVRAATQDCLALLTLGMLRSDDLLETRLHDAVQHAGLSDGEEIDATVELRRGPLPTLEQFAAGVAEHGVTDRAFPLFEHFLGDPDADLDILADIAEDLNFNFDADADEHTAHRAQVAALERAPQTVITGVRAVTDADETERDP